MKDKSQFVFIVAGSFKGKSLIALKMASKYDFSGVLSTDMIRNFYTVNSPESSVYSTSSYLMKIEDFDNQKEIVCNTLRKVMNIYENRGEKMIFEGMHFSNNFIKEIKDTPYLKIFLNNKSTPEDRFKYKGKTRRNFSTEIDSNKKNIEYEDTSYYKYEIRMNEIHENLRNICLKNGFVEVDYCEIDEAVNKCEHLMNEYLTSR